MSTLAFRLDKFSGRRVLCVGDLMLDRYIYGQVERVSPEAPIPVLHATRETATLGGAGNVARNISAMGGEVEIVGLVGKDKTADDLAASFAELRQITTHLLPDVSRPTTEKTRYVAQGQQLLRADREMTKPASTELENQLIARIIATADKVKTIILSDYGKGTLTPKVISETIKATVGKIIIIDPKGRDLFPYRGATYLTPNRKELSDAVGKPIKTITEAEEAARKIIHEFEISNVLVKLGSEGVCLVSKDSPALHFHTRAREVFDVSGAGDTVAAALALALAAGFTPAEAAEIANIAGSIVVGKVGTATVTLDEIKRELLDNATRTVEDKIVGPGTITDITERWRKQGLKVGFTNGCFDLLHPGHISLIRQARAACDRLVIGLNSDASVKRLKGDSRPIQNETARSTVLASLTDVDQVVIFGEDTPFELIKKVRPDVLVKGADYTIDKVVGADIVQSWGGKVVLAELVPGQSTTSTIAKIGK